MKFSPASYALLAATTAAAQNLVEVAESLPESLSTFVDLVTVADLRETLSAENITLFAPVNEAFDELDSTIVSNLLTEEWKLHLQNTMLLHATGSVIESTDLSSGTSGIAVDALNNEAVRLTLSTDGNIVVNNSSNVVEGDVSGDNGILHVRPNLS
jgi:uncharacterized surface protein with fasciclin (FAS1) repeats